MIRRTPPASGPPDTTRTKGNIMSDTPYADTGGGALLRGVADLPLIFEQIQNQLDDLRATVDAQQTQLAQQADRLVALERR